MVIQIRRRAFIVALGSTVAAWSMATLAQLPAMDTPIGASQVGSYLLLLRRVML